MDAWTRSVSEDAQYFAGHPIVDDAYPEWEDLSDSEKLLTNPLRFQDELEGPYDTIAESRE